MLLNPLEQHYAIDRLNALWLPAAFQPVHIDPPEGASPNYERSSSTLIVDTKYQTSDQLEYDVTSEIPAPTEEQLRAVEQNPPDSMAPYEELPDNFSTKARDVAQDVINRSGATDPYGKALALQDFFRDQRRVRERRTAVQVRADLDQGRSRQQRDRGVPRISQWLLRDVRRHLRRHGSVDRTPGARRRRLHLG